MKEAIKQLIFLIKHFDDAMVELLKMLEDKLRNAVEDRNGE